jgi:uncharacterized protein (DUF1778 family)
MPTMTEASANRDALKLRIKPEVRGLIDRAAALCGTNRTDFILEAAKAAAEEALLDQRQISVSPKAYAEFLNRLDQPPMPNERMRKTMQSSAPWEDA